jgi:recombination protein RecA
MKASPKQVIILDLATQLEIIIKRGAFYSYGDIASDRDAKNAKEFLKQNAYLANEIELAVRERSVGGEIPLRSRFR